jgi:heat shock protein HslJ
MQLMRWSVIVATAVVVLSVAACGDDDDSAARDAASSDTEATGDTGSTGAPAADADVTAALLGGTYAATEVTGWTLVAGSELTLSFAADLVVAEAGCNSMRGGWSVVDGVLAVETLAATLIGCPDDLQAQDQWLAAFLEGGPAVAVDGDVLTLTAADATITARRPA